MLLEVPFINGYNEFIEYFSKEIYVELGSTYDSYIHEVELLEVDVLEDSISYTDVLNSTLDFKIKLETRNSINYLVLESEQKLKNLKLNVQYTYKNNNPKNLYSVNYDLGLIHFSEKTSKEYKIEYQYDSIVCTGKSAHQLLTPDFNMVNNNINVKNYKENSLIYFLYKKEVIVHRNLTPVIQDLKLNYIIKDDISL